MEKHQPNSSDFWFLPLGGTGEIGMNLNLYGHSQSWIMVDCGATFNVPLDASKDKSDDVKREGVIIPNSDFVADIEDDLVAIIITHAHEDHIGALTEIWPKYQVPIYCTAFAAEVIRRKFYQKGLYFELPIVEVETGQTLDIGPFTIRWLDITHSIPETQGLLITTPLGSVFHTADWKIDYHPVLGNKLKASRFKALAKENILAMVCDSTNALVPGHSISERECAKGIGSIISQAKGRVVVTCFASNLARVITIATAAIKLGRYVALCGRALENMVSIARQRGMWPEEISFTPIRHIGYLPPHEIVIIATGSQGEPRAALAKMASDAYRHVELESNDSVIFSSIVIPGNEAYVEKLCQQFSEKGVVTFQQDKCKHTIHASGHPCQEDLVDMYTWVKPRLAIPTHGEIAHMQANAKIAKTTGVEYQLTGVNGDLFSITAQPSVKRKFAPVGRIAVDDK